jgi:hypothetical protein
VSTRQPEAKAVAAKAPPGGGRPARRQRKNPRARDGGSLRGRRPGQVTAFGRSGLSVAVRFLRDRPLGRAESSARCQSELPIGVPLAELDSVPAASARLSAGRIAAGKRTLSLTKSRLQTSLTVLHWCSGTRSSFTRFLPRRLRTAGSASRYKRYTRLSLIRAEGTPINVSKPSRLIAPAPRSARSGLGRAAPAAVGGANCPGPDPSTHMLAAH